MGWKQYYLIHFFDLDAISLFVYLFLAVLGVCGCTGFSLVVASRSYSLGAVHGLLIATASLLAEHRL